MSLISFATTWLSSIFQNIRKRCAFELLALLYRGWSMFRPVLSKMNSANVRFEKLSTYPPPIPSTRSILSFSINDKSDMGVFYLEQAARYIERRGRVHERRLARGRWAMVF